MCRAFQGHRGRRSGPPGPGQAVPGMKAEVKAFCGYAGAQSCSDNAAGLTLGWGLMCTN